MNPAPESPEDLHATITAPGELPEVLPLLEEFLRDGEPLPERFVERVRSSVERGDLYVIAASIAGRAVGVLTLAPRPSFALGGTFASIEDLYVSPAYRRLGVGRTLLSRTRKLCASLDISYVEVQVEPAEKGAKEFYTSGGFEMEEEVAVMSLSQASSGAENSSTS
ncbi:GNAT family N-acetyltransferase [Rubrobacter indicoceani]|uniref:GNAT family N-acetyltransferase n=1 Tax=Rubrobacter indicoceani TaxID=2051957 RepID=UPI000E5ABBF0|nr:GNAT family N-acetyltransferase [Rubrobacter indicoceani]